MGFIFLAETENETNPLNLIYPSEYLLNKTVRSVSRSPPTFCSHHLGKKRSKVMKPQLRQRNPRR